MGPGGEALDESGRHGAGIIVFDLNGTRLDLAALDGHFTRVFGSPGSREKMWNGRRAGGGL